MAFFESVAGVMQTLVLVLGTGHVNLLEGYGQDNPGANAHVR